MAVMKDSLYASVQAKKGRLYAVIQVKENGKIKSLWRTLNLEEGASQSRIKKAYRDVVGAVEAEYIEQMERENRSACEMPVFDYMCTYLKKAEPTIQINTYRSYHQMIYGKIKTYFEPRPELTVGGIKPKDIENFYAYIFSFDVTPNTVIHYHVILHRAFKQAFKDEIIDVNPFDRIDRPKKNKFQGENYTEDELIALLELTRSDPIYPAIVLGGGLGLRRSEALGVRWSRINWEEQTVLLDTKIVEYDENGETKVLPVEEMKNKTSRRTLPLTTPVYEMLKIVKEKQELNRRMFKGSHNREYDDYVCTDPLGELLRPGYVTQHFSDLLKRIGLRHIRFHDLRHTFASILINNDVPLINVSNFLGHSTISTTANIYGHLDKASKKTTANVLSGLFSGDKQ